MEAALKQRDEEWKKEAKERDTMWREELRARNEIFWEESWKQEHNLCTMLVSRDNSMKNALEARDVGWLNSL